mgnify:CR=1 FL=1
MVREMNTVKFDPTQLCSRKLWQLVNTETDEKVSARELREAIAELASRRQNLEKLQQFGILEQANKGA